MGKRGGGGAGASERRALRAGSGKEVWRVQAGAGGDKRAEGQATCRQAGRRRERTGTWEPNK